MYVMVILQFPAFHENDLEYEYLGKNFMLWIFLLIIRIASHFNEKWAIVFKYVMVVLTYWSKDIKVFLPFMKIT